VEVNLMFRASRAVLGTAVAIVLAWTPAATAQDRGPQGRDEPRTARVSTAADGGQADGPSSGASISADGRQVAFTSTAPNLACERLSPCLFLKDLADGGLTRIDLGSGHTYDAPLSSADGSRVAFSAGNRLQAPHLYDSATGRSERLWPQDPPGLAEVGRAQSISPDGTHVAYTVGGRNGGQTARLLYARDTETGTEELISPAEEGNKSKASVSGDGNRVAYSVQGGAEGNDPNEVFVKDRATGERIHVGADLGVAHLIRITADGRRVLLNANTGVYVHDLSTGASRRVADGTAASATADGRYAVVTGTDGVRVRDLRTGLRGATLSWTATVMGDSLAAKGRVVAFSSTESHLVPGDTNRQSDVFAFSGRLGKNPAPMPSVTERLGGPAGASHDPEMDEHKLVTFTSEEDVFINAPLRVVPVNSDTEKPSSESTPCSNGRLVSYLVPSAADGAPEVHIRYRATGNVTVLDSYQGVRFTWMGRPRISPTCQWITYAATLTATDADPDPQPSVYRFNYDGGTTDVVSAPSGGPAGNPSIDFDGRYIAFEQGGDVYVRDLDTGDLSKVADGASAPSLSGRTIAFQQGRYVLVRDLDTGTTTARVKGAQPSISRHGTEFAYTSGRSVYLLEIATGKRQLVSVDRWGGRNDLPAEHPSVNADGTVVAFESASPDLVEGDTNGVTDIFLRTVP
jgi:Tol biopolymer transport system component